MIEDNVQLLAPRKPIGLALQGGGSWGAYTWGVLDALLASRSIRIAHLSGTSAGAINAAIVASALAKGSPGLARKSLRSFWLGVARPAAADLGREVWGPLERAWRDSLATWLISNGSPYSANPLNINPLRDAIAAHVDFDAIRSKDAPALYVMVTNVKTGLPRVIANDDMTLDVLLASACLPTLFQAVEIDGEPYWDGGYCGNPTLWPMIHTGTARDIVVVQLVPDEVAETPRDAAAIRQRVGEIVFNSSLVAEMQAIAAMRALAARGEGPAIMRDLRMHRIGPPARELILPGSALERSHSALLRLHDEGRSAGREFIARHGADVGMRETLDIARVYIDARKPKVRVAANDEAAETAAVQQAEVAT
jgi:NTE family protein